MSEKLWGCLGKIILLILSLRYRIKVKGLQELLAKKFEKPGGILFLPNHPAHMDPFFLFMLLWPRFRMRPLTIEYIYRLSILRPWMRLVKAIAVPNFETSISPLKIKRAEEALDQIVAGLRRKENFLLYPSGRLKGGAKEVLAGASGAQTILEKYPDTNVVLIRTTGLWGSSFSRAFTPKSPDFPKTFLAGLKAAIKNFIFFCPRRDILIEIESEPPALFAQKTKNEFNRFLENWYNQYPNQKGERLPEEPLQLVSRLFWKKDIPDLYIPPSQKKGSSIYISEETKVAVYNKIREILDSPGMEINPKKDLTLDLGMDSLNIAELIAFLIQKSPVGELHAEDVQTVEQVLEIAEGKRENTTKIQENGTATFPEEKERPLPTLPEGRTIPEAFLRSAERMRSFVALGDDLVGVMSYQKLKRACLVLAAYFERFPESHIAIALPASAGAYIAILAILFAKKVPVMLNWTLGPRYLEEMMAISGAKRVVSSWKFLDRLSHVDFGSLADQMLLLEDIREHLPLKAKLKGAIGALLPMEKVKALFSLRKIREEDPAVILFTSGTEASPKAVPLSHKNIISNQRSAMQCIEVDSSDAIYGILPPFHSFGFSVAGLFPLLSGIKVAFYPNPTDSFALAEGVKRWHITFFCSAPSFLKGLLQVAKKEDLKMIRLFVSGAEKAPEALFEKVKSLTRAKLIEGYGITECAPILTLNRPNLPPKGVGRAIPGVEICTIHPETEELLEKGREGEICVRGPNVFSGYLGAGKKGAFIQIEGKSWYRTGDLGYLDEEGSLILSGRLKRFTKVGGEMISLGAMEEALEKELGGGDLPSFAVIAQEKEPGKPHLILFSIKPIEKDEANEALKKMGFSRLIKIAAVRRIEAIPLLGTGKTNYRALEKEG